MKWGSRTSSDHANEGSHPRISRLCFAAALISSRVHWRWNSSSIQFGWVKCMIAFIFKK